MEIAKQVQGNSKKIAAGFCTLCDKAGNWICQSVSVDKDKVITPDANLQFHPCQAIRDDLEKHQILVADCATASFGYALNTHKMKVNGAEQIKNVSTNNVQNLVVEQR